MTSHLLFCRCVRRQQGQFLCQFKSWVSRKPLWRMHPKPSGPHWCIHTGKRAKTKLNLINFKFYFHFPVFWKLNVIGHGQLKNSTRGRFVESKFLPNLGILPFAKLFHMMQKVWQTFCLGWKIFLRNRTCVSRFAHLEQHQSLCVRMGQFLQ